MASIRSHWGQLDAATRAKLTALLLMTTAVLSGCQGTNHTQRGAVVGSGLGALTGAMIASESGNAKEGALVGGAVGLVAGSMIGAEEDAIQRDHQVQQASYDRQFARTSMTNADLIHMTQAGVSETVIVGAIHDRGGQFDLSPSGIIMLKNSGVSDHVILEAQHARTPASPPVIYAPPPRHHVSYGVSVQTGSPRCSVRPRCSHHHHYHW